jgi:hypothetical protein
MNHGNAGSGRKYDLRIVGKLSFTSKITVAWIENQLYASVPTTHYSEGGIVGPWLIASS